MFSGPVRGGTRGGQGDFKWSDVADDKDRENYLGHSILAPVGRWQKNRDITWYNKDQVQGEATGSAVEERSVVERQKEEARREELRRIKALEEDELSVALGFGPAPRRDHRGGQPSGGTNSNSIPVGVNRTKFDQGSQAEAESEAQRKAEKAARKAARAEKREKKALVKDWERRRLKSKSRREEISRRDGCMSRYTDGDRQQGSYRPRSPSGSRRYSYRRDDHQHMPLTRYEEQQDDGHRRRGSRHRSPDRSPRKGSTDYQGASRRDPLHGGDQYKPQDVEGGRGR